MALITSFNPEAITAGGSIIAYLREVKWDGSDLATPDTNHRVAVIKDSELADSIGTIKPRAEDGKVYSIIDDQSDVTFKLTLEQSDKPTYDMFKEMRGKFYRLYKQGAKQNGKAQEWIYPICRLVPKLSPKWAPGTVTEVPVEVTVVVNTVAVSIDNNTLPSEKITATDPIVIAAGESYMLLKDDDVGVAGTIGFGVGIAPTIPAYMSAMTGTNTPGADNYGNYQITADGSVMVWIPRFWSKITNVTAAPFYGTKVEVRPAWVYANEAAANADGYFLPRAFIDGGQTKAGFFVDKYMWSLTNFVNGVSGIASSIKNGNPITSSVDADRDATNNFAGCFADCISNSQAPVNIYGGAWVVAKSRGSDFAVVSRFIREALGLLQLAQAQAATSTDVCAWYDAAGIKNFPKGNNNFGADVNDPTVTFSACDDAYWASRNEARQTGSGSSLAKTTHNGQACGVADLNGNQYEIQQGLTCIASSLTIVNAVSTDGGTKVQITFTGVHGLLAGAYFQVASVVGMTDLNDKIWSVSNVVDTTNVKIVLATVQTYVSGGSATKGTFYTTKESIALKNVTGGNSLSATDHFNPAFLAANANVIVPNLAGAYGQLFGSGTNQVLDSSVNRTSNSYRVRSALLPRSNGFGTGSNNFGLDIYYQYIVQELCPVGGGSWDDTSSAGLFAVLLTNYRSYAYRGVSSRSCLYV